MRKEMYSVASPRSENSFMLRYDLAGPDHPLQTISVQTLKQILTYIEVHGMIRGSGKQDLSLLQGEVE